jgi:hypothetical protein
MRVVANALSSIAEAALKNRRKQVVMDGEAVVLGIAGIPIYPI